MALKRAFALFLRFACAFGLLCACSSERAAPVAAAPVVELDNAPRRAGRDAILVFVPPSTHTREAWQTLRDELTVDFDVVTRAVSETTDERAMAQAIGEVRPRAVVLLGNTTTNLYLKYQKQYPGPYVPAVVLMASFLGEQHKLLQNATGIAYEIPGITTFVHLRSFVERPVHRIGLLHRAAFSSYVREQAALAAVEKLELVAAEVSDDPGPREIRRALQNVVEKRRVDALWVLNDNVLLTPELIAKGWLKALHKTPVLVVVGVSSLVDTRLHFGSFAMLPDHSALGVQAANLIFKLSEHQWNAAATPIQLPLSIQSVVDLPWTREHLHFREEALDRIDRVVQ